MPHVDGVAHHSQDVNNDLLYGSGYCGYSDNNLSRAWPFAKSINSQTHCPPPLPDQNISPVGTKRLFIPT